MAAALRVTLVAPPIVSVARPCLGISLLKAALQDIDCRISVYYASMSYASSIGVGLNQYISEQLDQRVLAAEWIFAGLLSARERASDDEEYVETVLRPRVPAERIESIRKAKAMAPRFVRSCAEAILGEDPAVVGFSSTFQQHCASLALAKAIKELAPEVVICFGGANCESEMGRATQDNFAQVDYVFSGEGEPAFRQFLLKRQTGDSSSTVFPLYGEKNGNDRLWQCPPEQRVTVLDETPVPDFSDYFAMLEQMPYRDRVRPAIAFETSRGCWWGAKHHCTFCGLNGANIDYRVKSAGRVLQELRHLAETWQIRDFLLADCIVSPHHIDSIFGHIPPEWGVRIFAEIKSNLSHDKLATLARGGVTWTQPGIESLSDHALRLMRKGVSRLQNLQHLRSSMEIGMIPLWNVLVGFPGEGHPGYRDVIDLIPNIEHLYPPTNGPTFIRVDRFSPYFEGSAPGQFVGIRPLAAYHYVYDLPEEEIRRLAYFFEGEASDAISQEEFEVLRQSICRWRDRFFDKGNPAVLAGVWLGDSMLVRDSRDATHPEVMVLDPPAARVLQEARTPRSMRSLAQCALDACDNPESVLRELAERRFLVLSNETAVSVVIEAGLTVHSLEELEIQPCGSLCECSCQEA